MKIIFRKNEKKVIELFRQLENINSELLSVDTEISFLNDNSPATEVAKLENATCKLRQEREVILFKINRLA